MTISDDFLEEMAAAVRVNLTSVTEQELTTLILAACADLKRQGVADPDLDDDLTKQAVKLYCKGHYGYDKDSERYLTAYESLSAGMSLYSAYKEGDSNG